METPTQFYQNFLPREEEGVGQGQKYNRDDSAIKKISKHGSVIDPLTQSRPGQ
jgi:hypothetical protein